MILLITDFFARGLRSLDLSGKEITHLPLEHQANGTTPAVTYVTGPSGGGKSTVLRHLSHLSCIFQVFAGGYHAVEDDVLKKKFELLLNDVNARAGSPLPFGALFLGTPGSPPSFAALIIFDLVSSVKSKGKSERKLNFSVAFFRLEENVLQGQVVPRSTLNNMCTLAVQMKLKMKLKTANKERFPGLFLCTDQDQIATIRSVFSRVVFVPQDHTLPVLEWSSGIPDKLCIGALSSHAVLTWDTARKWCPKEESRVPDQLVDHFSDVSNVNLTWDATGEVLCSYGGNEFPLSKASGGQRDSFITLLSMTLKKAQLRTRVVLLDEPGQNLGTVERAKLGTVLRSLALSGIQVVLVTHHAEILDQARIPFGIFRVDMESRSYYKHTGLPKLSVKSYDIFGSPGALTGFGQKFLSVLRSSRGIDLLFARQIVLVEGRSDASIVRALLGPKFADRPTPLVLVCDGCLQSLPSVAWLLHKLDIAFTTIQDYDSLFQVVPGAKMKHLGGHSFISSLGTTLSTRGQAFLLHRLFSDVKSDLEEDELDMIRACSFNDPPGDELSRQGLTKTAEDMREQIRLLCHPGALLNSSDTSFQESRTNAESIMTALCFLAYARKIRSELGYKCRLGPEAKSVFRRKDIPNIDYRSIPAFVKKWSPLLLRVGQPAGSAGHRTKLFKALCATVCDFKLTDAMNLYGREVSDQRHACKTDVVLQSAYRGCHCSLHVSKIKNELTSTEVTTLNRVTGSSQSALAYVRTCRPGPSNTSSCRTWHARVQFLVDLASTAHESHCTFLSTTIHSKTMKEWIDLLNIARFTDPENLFLYNHTDLVEDLRCLASEIGHFVWPASTSDIEGIFLEKDPSAALPPTTAGASNGSTQEKALKNIMQRMNKLSRKIQLHPSLPRSCAPSTRSHLDRKESANTLRSHLDQDYNRIQDSKRDLPLALLSVDEVETLLLSLQRDGHGPTVRAVKVFQDAFKKI